MTSNAAETINSAMKVARELPITPLLECLRGMQQEWNVKNRAEAEGTFTKLAKLGHKMLTENYTASMHLTMQKANNKIFKVCKGPNVFVVDIEKKTCSCNRFQMDELPCPHAICAIRGIHEDPEPYCSKYYYTETMLGTYSEAVYPVGIDTTTPIANNKEEVIPPPQLSQTGRKKRKRYLSSWEKGYKSTGAKHSQTGRRRREDNMVEIRKNKREESLLKKRREGLQQQQQFSASLQSSAVEKKLESLPSMVAGVWSNDANLQLEATTQFRKLLSIERSPPIEEVIQSGVVPRFVEFLTREDFPQLQFEAAWALTNIASGTSENTRVVIDHGAVPIFVKLLGSPSDDVREQAVWALGNVAGDSPKCRDLVLGYGALIPLLSQLNENAKLSMLRNATWTLSNFCRGKPQPPFEQVRPALPALQQLVYSNDEEVLTDACWALSYLSDGANDKIQAVIEAGVCQRLVELLLHPSPSVLIPALRTVGNIVTGDDAQTQFIINSGALPCLLNLLTHHHKKSIKKEACWTISNITAGNREQIQAVIDAGLIGPLVNLLQNAEFDIKKEAAWAISNATSGGTNEQIMYLVNQNCIKPLCDLLVCPDPRIVTVCLEGLENILKVGEAEKGNTGDVNYFAQLIDEAEGLEKIENLQSHDNNEIYEKAVKMLETYWLEEDETIPESDGNQAGFNFGENVEMEKSVMIVPMILVSRVMSHHRNEFGESGPESVLVEGDGQSRVIESYSPVWSGVVESYSPVCGWVVFRGISGTGLCNFLAVAIKALTENHLCEKPSSFFLIFITKTIRKGKISPPPPMKLPYGYRTFRPIFAPIDSKGPLRSTWLELLPLFWISPVNPATSPESTATATGGGPQSRRGNEDVLLDL
ncbi:importin subunit alpha [Striga asiatica]|uniref:Importin subunit alpha n=1 Tax=Striga asiatica TaxID=4170 RepID=A0A5A7QR32_STRAF|nr:importin subunit alpha [Striga asiatica]